MKKYLIIKGNSMKLPTKIIIACFFLAMAMTQLSGTLQAQDTKFRDQAWRYGLQLGLNYNSASLGYQDLHAPYHNFDKPDRNNMDNVNGKGYGFYGGLFLEYLSESWWGVQLRGTWDMRDALVKDIYPMQATPQSPNTEFDTRMSYLSFEPAIRIDQHVIPGLSLTAGPLLAANIHGTYDFKADVNGPVTDANVKVPDRPVASLGLTAGLAYDLELSRTRNTSFYLSPFFDYSWIAGQRKSVISSVQNSSNDIWSTQTFRFGFRLSWESRNTPEERITAAPPAPAPEIVYVATPAKKVFVVMPDNNTIVAKRVNGYYPILPYVFFEKGNKEIPVRYAMFAKDKAGTFNETDLELFKKGDMTVKETNIDQLAATYYHVMNIYADRMRKNPNETLTLRGCDPEEKDGEAYVSKVKNYLVNNFGIDANRIKIIIEPPRKPSGSALTDPAFNNLIDDENRRVVFVFSNQDMYRPVPYSIMDVSSIDNDMIFNINNDVQFKSWNISLTGENKSMNFGPFKHNSERVNPSPLMRDINDGNFTAKITITMKDGKQTTENLDFKLHKAKEYKNASRYLMLFDYNKSDAILSYETKIKKEITPGMKEGNTVIIHGHTDIIGNEDANLILSQERADQGKRIVDKELGKENKRVNVQAFGIGQEKVQYTFDNGNPEGRMYNRNVFVEVIDPNNISETK
jgi:outer membrane protein OmpA-like peptidoglycan-associated protein